MGETKVVESAPSSLGMMLKAAAPVVPGLSAVPGLRKTSSRTLPDLQLLRQRVPVDPAHVGAYESVCAFPRKETLPLPYLHMLVFPLHMTMLTAPTFPFAALGLVHIENTIIRHRPTTARERYDVSVTAENLRSHAKGTAFDFVASVSVEGETVWEEVSTYLRRGKGDDSAPAGLDIPVQADGGVEWRLPGDLGRRYAAVSGDRNPIHLYALTAKAFGFKQQIAHGMWTKARSIAAVENRLPDAVRVDTVFKTPVFLPGKVRFSSRTIDAGVDFSVVNPRNGAPHLAGRARPLPG